METTSQPSGENAARGAIAAESKRIEEDALYSAKGHYEAARAWGGVHLSVGIPTAVLAAIASVSAFSDHAQLAGAVAMLVAALSAVSTFLNPSQRANAHHGAGNQFNSIRSRARILREIDIYRLSVAELTDSVKALAAERDKCNQDSPVIPRLAFHHARKGIEAGEAGYAVDAKRS